MAEQSTNATRNVSPGRLLMAIIGVQVGQLIRAPRARILGGVQFLPIIAALIYVTFGDRDGLSMFSGVVDQVVLAYLLPLVAVYFGAPAIVEEVEGRTLTYLLLRPIGKVPIFVGKVFSGFFVAAILVVVPTLVLFAICLLGSSDLSSSLTMVSRVAFASLIGCYAYVCIFGALGAIFSSSLVASILYFVVVEMVVSRLPMLELLSVRFHLRSVAGFESTRAQWLDQLFLEEPIRLAWWLGAIILSALGSFALAVGALTFRHRSYHV
jgi:ABC-2 type transport system permease protein